MDKRCMGCMKTYSEEFDVCPHCGYVEGTPAKEVYHMEPGTVLHGKYIVGRTVGYGGFGVTYIGWDFVLEQVVAIKEYLPSEFATRVPGEETITVYTGDRANQFAMGRDKFFDEAKRLARFNGLEGIVEIKDTFTDNDTAYIVMEFLEGETLKERLAREGRFGPDEALPIIKTVLQTLEEVHKENIIHRDIAPDNIFLCSDGSIKLIDFGASRYATVQHSKSLSIILKEGYAPEEQYRSKGEQGSWSDVYAVGATLYKMLTGVTPEDAMERAENDKLKPVSKFGVKLSKSEETALMNAMNVFSEDRTQTAEQFMQELDADSVKRKERTRKKIDLGKWPLWSKILVGCIALVLAATGFLLSQKSSFALEDGQAYVPEVINMKDSKAQKKVEKNNLVLKIIGQEKSDKVDESKVMTQYPDSGRIVNEGELVEVQISAGNTVVMVDLSGKSQAEAKEILELLGFSKIEFKEKKSAAPVGTVINQSVKAGDDASVKKKLVITISKGLGDIDPTKDVKVPDFIGLQYNEAVGKATATNLYIVKKSVKASDAPAGTVISQDVKKGSTVKQGTTINVVISSGDKKVEVPYVMYMSEDEARQALSAYGFKCSVSYKKSDTVSAGLVMSQSISAGREEKPGTRISIVVSKGRDKVNVPGVSGMGLSAAADKLLNSELRYTAVYTNSESVGYGKVISASPGGKQEKGTKITLTVSCGTAGKLVSASEYNNRYSDSSKYSASKRYRYASRNKESGWFGKNPGGGWTATGERKLTEAYEEDTWYTSNPNISSSANEYGSYIEIRKPITKDVWYSYTVPYKTEIYSEKCVADVFPYVSNGYVSAWYAKDGISKSNSHGLGKVYIIKSNQGYTFESTSDDIYLCALGKKSIYGTKVERYQNKFWRWGSWSGWGDWTTRQSADGVSLKEDSTVMYYVVGKAPN